METVSKLEMVTWKGWVVYHWDHQYLVALFDKEPNEREDPADSSADCRKDLEWDGIRSSSCTIDFLEACGIHVKYGAGDEDLGHQFFYGSGRNGYHKPMQIELTIPKVIAELIGIA